MINHAPSLKAVLCAGIAMSVLSSCMDSEQQSRIKQQRLEQETQKMLLEIKRMDEEAARIIPVPEELLTTYEHDLQILEKREQSLDDYISALTLRRDALKLKLEEFRRTHPAK